MNNYNDRLLNNPLRRFYHLSRFRWLNRSIEKLKVDYKRVIEIGCADAKTLDYLPKKPDLYLGIDANWENLLELAREKYKNQFNYLFIEASNPRDIILPDLICRNKFDLAICMETFEHLDNQTLEDYIDFLKVWVEGYLFISVPVEIGPVFLMKHLTKRIIFKDDVEIKLFKPREVFFCSMMQSHKVKRVVSGHKGFDYRDLIKKLKVHFKVAEIAGIPFNLRPFWLNLTIGVVCKI